MKDYYSRKIRNRRRSRGKKLLTQTAVKTFFSLTIRTIFCVSLIFISAILLHHLLNFIGQSSCLVIKETRFEGCRNVSPQELMTLAQLRPGANIFAINLKEISRRLKTNPWVKEVKIKRNFPHRLTVNVDERVPVALVNHKKLFLVDEEGILFKEVEPNDNVDMPVITGLSFSQPNAYRIKKVLTLLDATDKTGDFSRDMISEVHIDNVYGLTLYTLHETIPVLMGFGDYGEKLKLLAGIREDLYKRRIVPKAIEFISSKAAHIKVADSSYINTYERR